MREIVIEKIKIGGKNPIFLIAGPCVIENESSALEHAESIKKIALQAGIPLIYKSSYDKANRTSGVSFRGPGFKEGLRILKKVKEEFEVPVLSDVHTQAEIKEAEAVLDILQIPAFLCRQTDLLIEAGKSGKPVNIKKGQFLAPWDMQEVIKKLESTGNKNILLTERGTSFGYNNLVSDFRSLIIMKKFGYPVIYDASHSVQLPGGKGSASGGERQFIKPLALAATSVGCDGIFIEIHKNPDKAPCDGPSMLCLKELSELLKILKEIDDLVHGYKKS